jgi:hypothetical protein
MSSSGAKLLQVADTQLVELIALIQARDQAALAVPCPGREKLGDGTVAACASHTAENYLRIAAFLRGEDHVPDAVFRRARAHTGGHDAGRHHAPPMAARSIDRRCSTGYRRARRPRVAREPH